MAQKEVSYVALLRGINVGGNTLKMERLRELCAGLGAKNVRTYVQSGNVVFRAEGSETEWVTRLQKKLLGETRLPVSVIVRTAAQIAAIVSNNPFLSEPGIELARLAVTFLQQQPTKQAIANLHKLEIGRERFDLASREIYLHCPEGFANAKLYLLDKVLGQKTTVRNWSTVTKLSQMAGQ
ncbi:MAG TPA: DUF1697 domain-containing protein [Candidatus Aquilonibacter sp.]|nr:DUF1697 domain-containing protein [Candidatus Aquilonibacter sp.]